MALVTLLGMTQLGKVVFNIKEMFLFSRFL